MHNGFRGGRAGFRSRFRMRSRGSMRGRGFFQGAPDVDTKNCLRSDEEPLETVNSQVLFSAGQIKSCLTEWEKLTSNQTILQMVEGLENDFVQDLPPKQSKITTQVLML